VGVREIELRGVLMGYCDTILCRVCESLADIAVSALLAPVLCPKMYVSGKYDSLFNALESRDSAFHEELTYWRSTTAGVYALEMYAKYR